MKICLPRSQDLVFRKMKWLPNQILVPTSIVKPVTHFLSIIELFHDVGPSTIHSDDNDADGTDQDRERLEWSTFEELLEHFKAEAKLNGTRIG